MYDNFSIAAQAAMAAASEESVKLVHYYVGVEHMFIGLCQVGDAPLARAMQIASFDPIYWRRRVRTAIATGIEPCWERRIFLTPRAQRVAKIATRVARQERSDGVEPSHLFLAILAEGEGLPVRLMREAHVNVEGLQNTLSAVLQEAGSRNVGPGGFKTPALSQFGRDLTFEARQGKLSPLVGRKDELRKMVQVLLRRNKNNPLIVGEAGVGKSCLVYGLAQYIVGPDALDALKSKRVVELNMSAVVAGTRYRGDFEERLQQVLSEARTHPEVILFLDEFHTVVGAGSASGSAMDAGNILKPALANGEISCIGATTISEYRRHIEPDAALDRRFEVVNVAEPSQQETVEILKGLRKSLQDHHQVQIADDAISTAVKLAARYITDRSFPDKAIDVIDTACTQKVMGGTIHQAAGANQAGTLVVTKADVVQVVAQKLNESIPEGELAQDDADKALALESRLRTRVVGQEEAVSSVARVMRQHLAGLRSGNRPIAVFLFVGPTGVGKTELALALTSAWFGSEKKLLRFDMSEYMEPHSVARLVGSPPGYVGHEEEGQLTGAVRTHPFSVLLLDEVEKAHPEVMKVFLQVFDAGRLTDAKGRVVNFSNTVIIMTSNLAKSGQGRALGFMADQAGTQKDRSVQVAEVKAAVAAAYPAEFRNRIDEVVVFRPVNDPSVLAAICRVLVGALSAHLWEERRVRLTVDDRAAGVLIQEGASREFGARELRRTIEKRLGDALTDRILSGEARADDAVSVTASDGALQFRVRRGGGVAG
jgi:ATP-dependent Clp protease ATP-binding subunit ClpC